MRLKAYVCWYAAFKLVVPPAELGVDATRRDVNALTITWDKVMSNALR